MSVALFVGFAIVILVINIRYTSYKTNKALQEMAKVTNEAIQDIHQQAEELLDCISRQYNKEGRGDK